MSMTTPEDDNGGARRQDSALETAMAAFPDVSPEEKAAFMAYCEAQGVGRRRLKPALFETFLKSHRRQALVEWRLQQAGLFVEAYADLIREKGLEATAKGFRRTASAAFNDRGVTTTLNAEAVERFSDLDVGSDALDRPDVADQLLTTLRSELDDSLELTLDTAAGELRALTEQVLSDEGLRWLGDAASVRERFLQLPPIMAADAATLTAERRRKQAMRELHEAKLQSVSSRLGRQRQTRLDGRTLQKTYKHDFPFAGGAILPLAIATEMPLGDAEIDALAAAEGDALAAAVDRILGPTLAVQAARLGEQIEALAARVVRLPHIELLTADEIARIATRYYGGQDQSPHTSRRRRARSALVAIEERAREAKYRGDVERLAQHRSEYADVARYYPVARSLGRKLVLYVGPTNSGKTWHALNELAQADSGAYLAPLRLLALEGQEELEKRGRTTSFLTGEERDLKDDARFISSTIEMLNYDTPLGAVVIDEVQLLADERRGWAWLGAVLGAPARRVIMTGSPDCIDLVKGLAADLGEELEIHALQRFNELKVADRPMRLRDVRRGTAIVCFSRRDVLRLKATLEGATPHRVAVVYGNLSPQVRREEARRFRGGEADVLVATDAIAMGLNLPITEVVFYATQKFDGEQVRELTAPEIRQIAGRAGRYGFAQFGVVNAFSAQSLSLIRSALRKPPVMLEPPYYVAPGPNHVRIISKVLETNSLERILTFFEKAMDFSDERFTRSNIDELSFLSTFVDEELGHVPVGERLTIASAPVDIKSETVLGWFIERMLPAFREAELGEGAAGLDELFEKVEQFQHEAATSTEELRDAEDYLKTLTVYAWLAYRYPAVFDRLTDCEAVREQVNAFIERSLRREIAKRCVACGTKLPRGFPHHKCDQCYSGKRFGRRGRKPWVQTRGQMGEAWG
jgi:ATP-dependent RNA helicase SUPV3L1/SUV3